MPNPHKRKVQAKVELPPWRRVYDDWLLNFEIDSKEYGTTPLKLWGTQSYALDQIAAGMAEGVRFFVLGKGRQYGITTCIVPLDVLWALTHPGIEGAIIGHKADVTEVCRAQILDIHNRLPATHKVEMKTNNKDKIEWRFPDGTISTINLLTAGTSERKTDLAKGHGMTFVHATETGEWGSETALNSLIASLAREHPDRLYIFESTGEGANNLFARLWRKSLDHPARRCIFIPWWAHDLYRIDKRTKAYRHYMAVPDPSDEEIGIIEAAKAWGHDITDSQLAFYRSMRGEMTSLEEVEKNYPSIPDDMFQLGADAFIPGKPIAVAKKAAHADEFIAYRCTMGDDIAKMVIKKVGTGIDEADSHFIGADLRVWREPLPRGVYCLGIVPSPDEETPSAVEVLRCYADGMEQVAEFAALGVESYQLAWIAEYLAGWYKTAWVNVDLADGGRAVFREMTNVRDEQVMGIRNDPMILNAMMFYLYSRVDNVSGGSRTWNWEWNANTQLEAFTDFKNHFLVGRLTLHSVPLLDEMATIVREGNYIGGDDDMPDTRTKAVCIALRTYVDHVRRSMQSQGKTREHETLADVPLNDKATFLESMVAGFMRRRQV